MINIILPDGSKKEFDHQPTGFELAESIGAGLAKAALAMKVNGEQRDLSEKLADDDNVAILTVKQEEGLEIMRHTTTAQVLARAVKLLWPSAKLAIGPTIDNGFYYDVELDSPHISTEDLPKIEAKMQEIMASEAKIQREIWKSADAIKMFEGRGENYKAEIIRDAGTDEISLYRQGEGGNEKDGAFIDLCRGPHVPSLKHISPAFKLTKVSGAYWRGDAKNKQLQRIYGVSFADKKQLDAYLHMVEEAEKRDHRKLATALDLFHIQEEATGQVFWHPKGWTLYRTLENYIRGKLSNHGYVEVKTPMLVDRVLWEKSGHWEKFREAMFTAESEERTLAVKPMNCPCHVQIFNKKLTSYKELPIRMAEFGSCHRNEPSGALHGIMRVRGFTQDDAHIFCMEEQITEEVTAFCKLLLEVYKEIGFEDVIVKFSDRPEVRAGDDATWDRAEKALIDAVDATGLEYTLNPGEGAFYGPKLEFVIKDSLGRDWQCGTIQVDFVLPERLDANYVGKDGAKHRPVMLHRAILGSFERFIGILIEHYAGDFPLWLSPVQVAITTITPEADDYAREVFVKMQALGMRVELDIRDENISQKIKEHSEARTPIIAAIGKREVEERKLAIRRLGSPKQEFVGLDAFLESISQSSKNNPV
ncbi:MAG: threonine--tRNA ligase [Alphaproteobacteria bacterium CG11_big_fil_rev_8_21_14_0_20_44_7]|nr:MAG: threonine--tRNA ligase [Alphaproteobacteria bacterium CG11_big_fil_rev_8_21_14_0_20_44_7]